MMTLMNVANYFIEDRIAKEKQLVQHTAQTTALHFESKIEKYLSAADFLKNYLSKKPVKSRKIGTRTPSSTPFCTPNFLKIPDVTVLF